MFKNPKLENSNSLDYFYIDVLCILLPEYKIPVLLCTVVYQTAPSSRKEMVIWFLLRPINCLASKGLSCLSESFAEQFNLCEKLIVKTKFVHIHCSKNLDTQTKDRDKTKVWCFCFFNFSSQCLSQFYMSSSLFNNFKSVLIVQPQKTPLPNGFDKFS